MAKKVYSVPIRFGRLVKNVSNVILPWTQGAYDMQNVDISKSREASRRNGYQRALDAEFDSTVRLAVKWVDYDGTESYIVVDQSGVNRQE